MKQLKNQSGFTLAETLMAVLILLLVSTIVATGIPVARNAYEKVILGANAQAMLSNAITNLRDELGTAWEVKVEKDASNNDTEISYFNANTGAKARISLETKEGSKYPAILIQDYIPLVDDLIHTQPTGGAKPAKGDAYHLVPDKNTSLYVTYKSIELDKTKFIVKVNDLKVCKQSDDTPIYELKDASGVSIPLEIQLLSKDVK